MPFVVALIEMLETIMQMIFRINIVSYEGEQTVCSVCRSNNGTWSEANKQNTEMPE